MTLTGVCALHSQSLRCCECYLRASICLTVWSFQFWAISYDGTFCESSLVSSNLLPCQSGSAIAKILTCLMPPQSCPERLQNACILQALRNANFHWPASLSKTQYTWFSSHKLDAGLQRSSGLLPIF